VRVAVVGGTGPFGKALARRLHAAGHGVVVGSRDADRAGAIADELGVEGAENSAAVELADLVVLATKADAAVTTARELAPGIGSTPVLCVASELRFTPGGVEPRDDAVSVAERVQEALEGPVVAGLHSLAASNLGGGELPDEDAFVCGDDDSAKEKALELAAVLTTGSAIDAGPLACARTLEGMTAVLVNVNRRYKIHAGIKLSGLDRRR
jgi:8-hydroxy-5-deazaflavin:NADPH oxidoreductase